MKKIFAHGIRFFLCAFALAMIMVSTASAEPAADEPKPKEETAASALPRHEHSDACGNTTAEPVEIICILDRSGSMQNLSQDTIGGYNSFVAQQREKEGSATITTVLFDDKYEKIFDSVPLDEVPELTSKEYYARGTTALLDAVGKTIMSTLGRMERDGVCPARRSVIVLIMTDGLENASREYSREMVKRLIEETTKEYKWQFVFMGANIDSVSEAQSIGIAASNAHDFDASGDGVATSFERMGEAVDRARER